jgi:hypothetical protein
MMPTVHYDAKKAEEAIIAFEAVANYCNNIVKHGPHAIEQVKVAIIKSRADSTEPGIDHDVKTTMLANATNWEKMIAPMMAMNEGAKAAVPVGVKLEAAYKELQKKSTDKKTMEKFAATLKDASVTCGKLRTLNQTFHQSLPSQYVGVDEMKAYMNCSKLLSDYVTNCLPKLAPPRPLTGPPKH